MGRIVSLAVTLASLALFGGSPTVSSAAVIAYDGFLVSGLANTYNDNRAISGQNPTANLTGFSAVGWVGDNQSVRPQETVASGLTYAGLATQAGSMHMTRITSDSTNGFRGSNRRPSSPAGNLSAGDTTRWVSFLINSELKGFTDATGSRLDTYFSFGTDNQSGLTLTLNSSNFLSVSAPNSTVSSVGFQLVEAQTHMIMLRVDHQDGVYGAGSESMTMWLDPSTTTGPIGSGLSTNGVVLNASLTASDLKEFSSTRLSPNLARRSGVGQTVFFDELRVGTTMDSIGVIPEPSTALLAAIGTLALLRRRR